MAPRIRPDDPRIDFVRAPMSQRGFIYFVSDGENIKIGFARHVEGRVKSLQTASPAKLEVLASIRALMHEEKEVHARFAHLHIRGEWFYPAPELSKLISDINASGRHAHHYRLRISEVLAGKLPELVAAEPPKPIAGLVPPRKEPTQPSPRAPQAFHVKFFRWFRTQKERGFASPALERAATRLRNDLWAVTHNPGKDASVFRRGLAQSLAEFHAASAQ